MQPLNFSILKRESEKIDSVPIQRHCRTLRKRDKKKSSSKIDCLLNCLSTNNNEKTEGMELLSRRKTPCEPLKTDFPSEEYDDIADDGRRCDGSEFIPQPIVDDTQESEFINKRRVVMPP